MSVDDLKEFAKHLRSIHFAMVITSVAILIGISGGGSIYEDALVQLRDVNQLDEQFTSQFIATSLKAEVGFESRVRIESQSSNLENLLRDALQEFSELELSWDQVDTFSVLTYDLINDGLNLEYETTEANIWFESQLAILSDGARKIFGSHQLEMYGNTLRDKRESLDQIFAADTLFIEPIFDNSFHYFDSAMVKTNQSAIKLIKEKLENATDISISADIKRISLADQEARSRYIHALAVTQEDPIGYEQFDGPFDNFSLSLGFYFKSQSESWERFNVDFEMPFMFKKTNLKFIGAALKEIDSSDAVYPRYLNGARSASELFPELNEVTEYFSSAAYADIELYLKKQVAEKNTPISVFGLSINSQLVAIWGVVLLLCVQLYFCVHYRSFVKHYPKNETWVFPWMAMYRDKASMVMFQLSLLLPVLVCSVMLFSQGDGDFYMRWIFLADSILIFYWSERVYLEHVRRTN